jgi:hypothetical protein
MAGPDGPAATSDRPGPEDLAGPQNFPGADVHGPPGGSGHMPRAQRLWAEMMRREHAAAHRAEIVYRPAWRRRTRGEPRWPVTLTILAAIGLELVLPNKLVVLPAYLLPALEIALLVGLIIANPVRIERKTRFGAAGSIVLTLLITITNAVSAVLLVRLIVENQGGTDAARLLGSGAEVWLTNVIAFALWYWEFDRGGPVSRAEGASPYPDFLFPQMGEQKLTRPDWEPYFLDYLYLSFTNATAFSPTDVMPLARWAKLTMAAQSGVSLAVVVLVVARAVNLG